MTGNKTAAFAFPWARRAAGVVIVLVPAACGEADSAGTASLESRLEEWTVEQELRIGSVDDAAELLTRVDMVRIAPGGELVVAQPIDGQILVYGTDGQRMATLGRPGPGPGEFRNLDAVGLLGDTVYGGDAGHFYVNFFTLDGQFLSSRRWLLEAPPPPVEGTILEARPPHVILDDGSATVFPNYGYHGYLAGDGAGTLRFQVPLLRIDAEGKVLDTVAFHHWEGTWTELATAGDRLRLWAPFLDSPLVELSLDGSGAVFVDRRVAQAAGAAELRVGRIDPSGDTLMVESFAYRPTPVPEELVEQHAQGIHAGAARRSQRVPSASAIEGALRSAGFIPSHLPPVSALVPAGDGSIWLRREDVGADSVAWNVFDRELRPRGRIVLHDRFSVTDASGDVFVGVELDALDVPYVLRYRIRR